MVVRRACLNELSKHATPFSDLPTYESVHPHATQVRERLVETQSRQTRRLQKLDECVEPVIQLTALASSQVVSSWPRRPYLQPMFLCASKRLSTDHDIMTFRHPRIRFYSVLVRTANKGQTTTVYSHFADRVITLTERHQA